MRLIGAALFVAAGALTLFARGATAQPTSCGTLPSDSNVYINCAVPPASAPYTTFSDGQAINLSMGPNSTLSSSVGVNIVALECEYVNAMGQPGDPPDDTSCDAQTTPTDFPYIIRADGSFDYVGDQSGDAATVFALPDPTFPHANITCNSTNPCVWYVGEDYTNFSAPHFFSNPFYVSGGNPTTTIPPTTQPTSGSTTTTTTMGPGNNSTTTSTTIGSNSTTTTTTSAGGATTTTSTTSAAGSSSDNSGNGGSSGTGSGGSSGPSDAVTTSSGALAFTGQSPLLLWMMAFGLLLVAVGTGGRVLLRPATG